MIEPMWLKTTVYVNGIPQEVEPSAIDVAVKLNELIAAYNQHRHEMYANHGSMDTTSKPADPLPQPGEGK